MSAHPDALHPNATVAIVVNGEERRVRPTATLADLVAEIARHPQAVAVEHNGEIVRRPDYAATALHPGDRIEIVHFVQGG